MTRPTVLVVSDSFAPGFRGGGTRHAIAAVEALREEFNFLVLTKDREPGAPRPFDVETDQWLEAGGARVRYLSPRHLRLRAIARCLGDVDPDVVLTNSVFSRLAMRVLLLRRFGSLRARIIVAPEGEFYPGALALKAGRKRLFRLAARMAGLFSDVTWRATSDDEAQQIRAWAGSDASVAIAPVVTPQLTAASPGPLPPKSVGELRLLYLSRITPKKNLRFLLDLLADPIGQVHLDVVGPIGDEGYWRDCERAIARLPEHATVTYHGESQPDDVEGWIGCAHALVLPTFGENFGLVIHEALARARPVLVGVDTPWTGLEAARAGFNLPPDDQAAWCQALSRLASMDAAAWATWCEGARHVAIEFESHDDARARLAALLRGTV